MGDFEPGTKLVCIGDTGDIESVLPACKDADGLVIEGTYMNSEKEMAREFAHLTAMEAATLAASRVKHLYLTHISRRYRDKDVEKDPRGFSGYHHRAGF